MNLTEWSWLFLALYIALMVGIGLYAQRKIKHADDFATARGAYGPFFPRARLRRFNRQWRDLFRQSSPEL